MNWVHMKLSPPESQVGKLMVLFDLEEEDIFRIDKTKEWKTYYDSSFGWICIGDLDIHTSDKNNKYNGIVEFYPNVIAVICNGEFNGLWTKPIIGGGFKKYLY